MTITQSSTRLVALVAGVAVAISLVVGAFAAAPAQAAALTQSQISSIIGLLQSFGADAATIANVQASLTGGTPTTPPTGGGTGGACPALSRSLQQGSTGADVMALQKFLNGSAATQVSMSGAGSPGLESTFFGPATAAAVKKFQTLNNVSAIGIVGPQTRAAIAAVCGNSTTGGGTVTPTGPGLSISAGAQPANAIAPEGASRVPFTTFTIANNTGAVVTVTGVTVLRTGLGSDSTLAGVALVDASSNTQLGTAKTLNSNHQVTVGDSFTLNPGQSKMITVVGNMASNLDSYSGQIVSLQVVAINTTSPVSGSLPINGASHTINSNLSIGTANSYVSSYDPNTTSLTKSIGDTAVKFAGVRVTAGTAEAVRLWSVRWNQSGSASASDLSNVMVYVDGTSYPITVSSDGKYYTASFSGGIMIDKGLSKDIYVQGDVVGSSVSGRTIEFDIYKNTDIYLTGETYGYGVTVTPGGNTASTATAASQFLTSDATTSGTIGTPFFSASQITVNPGSATSISRASTVAAQNIAVNVPNQVLGGFTTDFRGESVSVQNTTFHFGYGNTTDNGELLTSVSLVDENGAVVAGPKDAEATGGNSQKVAFTDTITFPVGQHTYTLKGKLPSTISNGQTIVASTTPSSTSDWSGITGQTSGNSITLTGNGLFSMSTMTIKGSSLAVTLSTAPAAANIVSGGNAVTFANVQLDAQQSGEDIRLSSIRLTPQTSVVGISSCQILNGSSVVSSGSNAPSSLTAGTSATFNFDNAVVVTKGTLVTLTLKCNVSSAASGAYHWDLVSADWSSVTATGQLSGNTLTTSAGLTVTDASSGVLTVGSAGTLAVVKDSSAPSYSVAVNGSTGVTLNVLRFTSSNEAINLSKIGLQLSDPVITASSSPSDLIQVTLWDGATQIGSATFTGTSRYATSSLTQTITVPKDGYKLVTIKGDLATLNTNAGLDNNAKPGALIKVDYDAQNVTGTQGVGVDSGATINAPTTSTSDTSVSGIRVFKSVPVITYAATAGTLTNGTASLVTVTVSANATGDVSLYKLIFNVSTTTAVIASPTFTGPNGSVGTVAIAGVTGAQTMTVTFDSSTNTADATIPAGTSKTYNIGGTISGVTTSGVVSFGLAADTAYPSLSTLMTSTGNLSTSNIIWSPNSTTTQSTSNNDWTNGYGLGGCFATSGLGQSCFSATKAQ